MIPLTHPAVRGREEELLSECCSNSDLAENTSRKLPDDPSNLVSPISKQTERKDASMAGIDVSYDSNGESLIVWFDHPQKTHHSEENAGMIVRKDERGLVIGVE